MSAPLVVNTADGAVWTRREGSRDGEALYAPEKCGACPQFVMVTLSELAELGITGSADVLPVPVVPVPQASPGGYPPALPWAALLDDEDLREFLGDLGSAVLDYYRSEPSVSDREVLVSIEKVFAEWRLIGEAQHGHNTAPGPDAVTRVFSPVASLREPEGEFYPFLHRDGRVPHDLPETGGAR